MMKVMFGYAVSVMREATSHGAALTCEASHSEALTAKLSQRRALTHDSF